MKPITWPDVARVSPSIGVRELLKEWTRPGSSNVGATVQEMAATLDLPIARVRRELKALGDLHVRTREIRSRSGARLWYYVQT